VKVRMKVGISGSRNGRPWPEIGEEVTLPDQEGKEMCESGMAEPVAEKPRTETREAKTEAREASTETREAGTAERRTSTQSTSESKPAKS
jgi:hypothetical protein